MSAYAWTITVFTVTRIFFPSQSWTNEQINEWLFWERP